MTSNDDMLIKLQNFIREENKKQTETLSRELIAIKELVTAQQEKINLLEKQVEELKLKNKNLEKEQRRNNLIIFNLGFTDGDLLSYTVTQLNVLLKINLTVNDIGNIYTIGKEPNNRPIIIEFICYLKKKTVLANCFHLKDTNIRITDQLSQEERKERKILVDHLKQARTQNQKAHIRGTKLYIEGKPFTAQELNTNHNSTEIEDKKKSKPELSTNNQTIPGNIIKKKVETTGNAHHQTIPGNATKRKLETTGNRSSPRFDGKTKSN